MRIVLISLSLALAFTACRCGEKIVKLEPARLVATPDALAFPDTYVGETSTLTVEFSNQGGTTAEADLVLDAPFSTTVTHLSLPRGESQNVAIVFSPRAADHFAAVLHAGDLVIPVQGRGLEIPQCTASTTCRDTRFDTTLAMCVETTSPNDASCETSCVVGTCQSGTCLGALKTCDDHNACTLDACSETDGCAHRDVTCPAPTSPCEVPTCDAQSGCGSTTAPDGTLCGIDDCIATTVDVCISGQCVQRTRPLTGRCTNRWVPTTIPARYSHGLAYDAARGRVVVFGGHSSNQRSLDDTWEWDGRMWTQLLPANSPEGRESFGITYDPRRQRVLLFGGWSVQTQTALGDTWEWDGRSWTQAPTTEGPTPRVGALMVFDSARQRALLFGGYTSGGASDETWSWNGSRWTLLLPAHTPPARMGATLAWDSARQVAVLFGGRKGDNTADLSDTWEWSGSDWVERQPAHSPSARAAAVMTYDPIWQKTVLSGGHFLSGNTLNDTWLWDGRDWTSPPYSPVRSAEGAASAYDLDARRLVVFGGVETPSGTFSASTRLWDGATWTELAPPAAPAHRLNEATLVSTPQRLLLFGGIPYSGPASNSLWTWDASRTWTQVPTPANAPSRRAGHSAAWDSARQRLVVFGGDSRDGNDPSRFADDTWEWDGTTWTLRAPATRPQKRGAQAMAFDAARNVTVLFGGVSMADGALLHDTWTWDGTTWTLRTSPTAPPCFGPMTYDASRQRIVFFSEYCNNGNYSNETWEWDGSAWSRKLPTVSPPGATGYGMTYDASRQRVVLTAGQSPNFVSLTGTWEWDGTTWLEKRPTVAPSGYGVAAYLDTLQKVVFFDGVTQWVYLP